VRLSAWLTKRNYFSSTPIGKTSSTAQNLETQRPYRDLKTKHRTDGCQSLTTNGAHSNFLSGMLYSQATGECTNHMLMPQLKEFCALFWAVPGTFQYCDRSWSGMLMMKKSSST